MWYQLLRVRFSPLSNASECVSVYIRELLFHEYDGIRELCLAYKLRWEILENKLRWGFYICFFNRATFCISWADVSKKNFVKNANMNQLFFEKKKEKLIKKSVEKSMRMVKIALKIWFENLLNISLKINWKPDQKFIKNSSKSRLKMIVLKIVRFFFLNLTCHVLRP